MVFEMTDAMREEWPLLTVNRAVVPIEPMLKSASPAPPVSALLAKIKALEIERDELQEVCRTNEATIADLTAEAAHLRIQRNAARIELTVALDEIARLRAKREPVTAAQRPAQDWTRFHR